MKPCQLLWSRASRTLLCGAFVLAGLGQGDVLWSADQETGDLSQWDADQQGGVFNTGTGTASATTVVAHTGRYSIRLAIRNARGIPQAARIFRWDTSAKPNTEAYYSAWYYFPQRYHPAVWWNIFQFKSEPENAAQSEPTWSLNVGNRRSGRMYLYLWDAINRRSYNQTIADLPERRWVHLEARYTTAVAPEGRITVWQDGRQLWDITSVQTTFANNVYWSVNSYTDDIRPSTVTIYVDDAVISSTRRGP
jgi:Polysaccharide lyase